MSHEIRTPISGVIGMIDLLSDAADDDPDRPRYRAALDASARTLLRVVDDVLDYSRFSSVGIALENDRFDLFTAVHNIIDLYRPAAAAKGLTLGLQFVATNRQVVGDRTRLGQVLGNLVSNAIKFTDVGRIDLVVDQMGQRWSFTVADTGVGLSAEQQGRLFNAFTQADEKVASKYGGTGLGLTIAQMIVEAMGGSIAIDSAPGEGARFTFEVILEAAGDQPVTRVPDPISSTTRPRRVLLADDNDVNLLYLRRLLERMGHRVTAVTDGQAAVDAAVAERFDVILLDRHMPVLNGDDAARQIRRVAGADAPLLVMVSAATAGELAGDGASDLTGMFDAILPKPVRPERLAALLESRQAAPALPDRDSARSELDRLLGSDASAELERLFRADLAERMPILVSAMDTGNEAGIRSQAHAIAGAAMLIGEVAIGEAAQRAETAPKGGAGDRAVPLRDACAYYLSIN